MVKTNEKIYFVAGLNNLNSSIHYYFKFSDVLFLKNHFLMSNLFVEN